MMKRFSSILFVILFGSFCVHAQSLMPNTQEPLPIRALQIEDMITDSNGKILLGGEIAFFETQRVHNLIRLNADGTLDNSFIFNKGGSFWVEDLELQSNGNIVALLRIFKTGQYFVYQTHTILLLAPTGEVLASEDLVNATSVAVQPNNKILVSGDSYLKRYSSTLGSDPSFNPVTFDDQARDVEPFNGKIYVAGPFSKVNGVEKNDIVRLNDNGTIDNSFDTENGTDDWISAITIDPGTGKIYPGTTYINNFNGMPRSGMVRLNTDGSVDNSFNPPSLNGPHSRIFVKDNKVYAAAFLQLNDGTTADRFFRVLDDGTLDPDFPPIQLSMFGAFGLNVVSVGSSFLVDNTLISGNVFGLSKMNSTGDILSSFTPAVSRFGTLNLGDFYNDKILVAGDFIRMNGFETYGIARLNLNGIVDESFALTENKGEVVQLEILDDDNILVSTGGSFVKLNAAGVIKPEFQFEQFKNLYQVSKFKVLDNGKIMAADPNTVQRLLGNGSEDASFNIGMGIEDVVSTAFDFDTQGDKTIFGSLFRRFDGVNVNKLIRLDDTGEIDHTFDIGDGPSHQGFDPVTLVKVLDNKEIIVGGWYDTFDGVTAPHKLVKLNENGGLDLDFIENQKTAPAPIAVYFNNSQVEQVGSTIFIRQPNVAGLYVLNTDGSVDTNFIFPSQIDVMRYLILKDVVASGGRKANTQEEENVEFFALGQFQPDGSTDPSFFLRVQLGARITGTSHEASPLIVKSYPNPVRDILRLTIDEPVTICQIKIQDFAGRSVLTGSYNVDAQQSTELDLRGIAPGMYVLKVNVASGKEGTIKILKLSAH